MAIIYTVYNHETGTESTMTQEQLEESFSKLKSGILEITDEIEIVD